MEASDNISGFQRLLNLFRFSLTWGGSDDSGQQREEIRKGYGYETFHLVQPPTNVGSAEPKIAFQLHFAVQGERDAHILLSPSLNPSYGDPVYEIVLGAGRNTFSTVRRRTLQDDRDWLDTPDILAADELRSFYIKLYTDGLLEVGEEGAEPLLSYTDETPLQIKYFSFGAYTGATVKFVHNYETTVFERTHSAADPIQVYRQVTCRAPTEEEIREDYGYDTFHPVQPTEHPKLAFQLNFAVQGERDAHILLSPSLGLDEDDPVYEIVLGAGRNTFSTVRRRTLQDDRASLYTHGIRSADELRNFYIKLHKDGLLEVGKEGEEPLLSYTDKTPLQIKYFSFGAYTGATVKFICNLTTESKNPENSPAQAEELVTAAGETIN